MDRGIPIPAAAGRMRLARFLAAAGIGSRRHCETLIQAGEVRVNGQPATSPATTVDAAADAVAWRGRPVVLAPATYILLNKPPGYTCSARDPHARRLVYSLVPLTCGRLFSVGRLDRESEGLLLLTNDGQAAQGLAHPSSGMQRVYRVWVKPDPNETVLDALRRGIEDRGEFLRPDSVARDPGEGRNGVLRVVLSEGRNREVRRLCAAVGLKVMRLQRIAFGPLRLGSLPVGSWRELGRSEREALLRQRQRRQSPAPTEPD